MTHLGRKGSGGRPTRLAYLAEKVNYYLVQVETRRPALEAAKASYARLSSEYDQLEEIIRTREIRLRALKRSLDAASREAVKKNPRIDRAALNDETNKALRAFEREHDDAFARITEVRKSVTGKRTAMRRLEDRMDHYRRQVDALLAQADLVLAA